MPSWQAVSQLMWGISDLCFAVYDRLQQLEPSDPASAVVASGGVGNMRWVAVPQSHADAFKVAYPTAHTAEAFYKVFSAWKRSNLEGFRYLTPFAIDFAEALETYGDECSLFVFTVQR